jgi:hypothetical protein
MPEIILRVTYKIRAHEMTTFEGILVNQVIPLAEDLGIKFGGFYRTLIGNVGEYMEIWEFKSLAEYEKKWPVLLNHPDVQEIFKVTGPMVSDEMFTILTRTA